ncbi:MAG: hypothetical protein JO134_05165 [Xanthobacteraceae bacterium]|nr:hypothetical protein [Xanthobacteraceae bacterium]
MIDYTRLDLGDVHMDERILRLLRRHRELEAERQELDRELREISRELFERNADFLAELASSKH